jgi:hypothetical protein
MKAKWTKKAPKITGWYWVKYQGKIHDVPATIVCPAKLLEISKAFDPYQWTVRTAKNDLFYSGAGLTDLMFGSKIEEPK